MAMVQEPLLFARLPPGARRVLFGLALFAICFLFAFPVLWLILTSLRPESGVYYVHRGTEFTLATSPRCCATSVSSRPSSTRP